MRPVGSSRRTPTSVYVHFPWCLKRCPYCDFATRKVDRPEIPHRAYADAVLRELELRAPSLEGRSLTSVFFGGGTPSLWEALEVGRVLERIHAAFDEHADEVEVTLECNPSSLDRAHAAALREAGVNRLSLGLQSLDDERLRFLGRFHDARGALSALDAALREHDRVSVDFMFGMPGQTANESGRAGLDAELGRVLDLGVRHVSMYALTIEPGTQFGELHRKGRLAIAKEDDFIEMFLGAQTILERHGLMHYEVSSYAAPGEEARHNLHYWAAGPCVGLGAAAVGCLDGGVGRARRWRNEPDGSRYIERVAQGACEAEEEQLDADTLVREAIMVGLRTSRGVDLEDVAARTGIEPLRGRGAAIERGLSRGDIVLDRSRLRSPRERWLRLDSIVANLF